MTIVILGAGFYQKELIRVANSYGEVHVLSNNRSDVGVPYADYFHHVSIVDFTACLKVVNKLKPSVILTSGSQLGAYMAARLCEEVNLDNYTFLFVESMTDKLLLRKWLFKNKLSTYNVITSEVELSSDLEFLIKPRIASGSRGIEKYNSTTSNLSSISNESNFVKGWIGEPLLKGISCSAMFQIVDGEVQLLLTTKKYINHYFVPLAHLLTKLSDEVENRLYYIVNKMVKEFDLESGFIDLDFIVTDSNVEIVDVGTRLSGNGLVELYNLISGKDLYKVQIEMLLNQGEVNQLSRVFEDRYGVMLYSSDREGVLGSYKTKFEELKLLKSFKFLTKGSKVKALRQGSDQLGFFIFKLVDTNISLAESVFHQNTIEIE